METTTGITVDQLRDLFYGLITPKSGNITIWIDPCAAAEKAAPWDVFIELHNVFGPHASQRQPDASLWYALPVYKSRYHEAVRAIKQALRGVKKK